MVERRRMRRLSSLPGPLIHPTTSTDDSQLPTAFHHHHPYSVARESGRKRGQDERCREQRKEIERAEETLHETAGRDEEIPGGRNREFIDGN